jgi:hypothetical protein
VAGRPTKQQRGDAVGIPLQSISWLGGGALGAEILIGPDRTQRAEILVEAPGGIVLTQPRQDLSAEFGWDWKQKKNFHDVLHAFWRAGGMTVEPLEPPQAIAGTQVAGPRLRRIEVVSSHRCQLTFATDVGPFRADVDGDGRVVAVEPELWRIGAPWPVVSLVSGFHRLRALTTDLVPPVLLQARSIAEAAAFLELMLPAITDVEWRPHTHVVQVAGGHRRLRFRGPYQGIPRTIEIDVPDDEPGIQDPYITHGFGASMLVDAGQWLYLGRNFAAKADYHRSLLGDDWPTDAEAFAIYQELRLSLAAHKELAKFLPDGADIVPVDVLWTEDSRRVWHTVPYAFRRDYIEESVTTGRQAQDDFSAKYSKPE